MISITGGAFQNLLGAPLAAGTLMLKLSQDSTESVTSPGKTVFAGPKITLTLDSQGNCPATSIWSNAELNEAGTYYSVNLFDVNGIAVLESPLNWAFTQTSGTVNLGSMTNSV